MNKLLGYGWYLVGTQLYFLLVRLIAPFNNRAKLLVKAQTQAWKLIENIPNRATDFTIWFHVSSLGEFEQGKPLMIALKKAKPDCKIIVSFFSPSGFLAKQKDPSADHIVYLPFESKKNAQRWVQSIQPKLAVWVKYDFWHNYLLEINKRQIPVFLIAAQFRPTQIYFKKWALFQRSTLQLFTHIFCQNLRSQNLLNQFQLTQNSLSGDNRYDRVKDYALNLENIPFIEAFKENTCTLILGSSYIQEERLLAQFLATSTVHCKAIIAPHFTDETRITEIEKNFKNTAIRYSQVSDQTVWKNYRVLIIDSIGLLARLYRYGDLAFVGGGFWENGLHNALEPCAFGMPIAFGPKLRRFPEAQELVSIGVAQVIGKQVDFDQWVTTHVLDKKMREEKVIACRQFVSENAGATQRVMDIIGPYLNK